MPINISATGKSSEFYPLKQFAPVIHGNREVQGRTAMGETTSSPKKSNRLF